MKQIIKDVLNIHGEMNVNLASDAARDVIAIEIIEKLKKKGFYTEYRKDELEKQEAKKGWVCQTCGKSTFETDYDYLVHPKLHLGCALEEELKGKTIHEQYHEASSKAHEDDVAKALGHMDDDGNYITKDIPEEKEEMDGNDIKEQYHKASAEYYKDKNVVRIPTGGEGSHQEISKGMKPLDWWKKENPQLESEINKLSEEIVDNKDIKYIYESPDGGKTIYRREFGSDEKELIKNG